MTTRLDLSEYDEGLDALSKAASDDLSALLSKRPEFDSAKAYRAYLQEQMPALSERYEKAASALAANSYETWRGQTLNKSGSAQTIAPDSSPVKRSAYSLSHPLKEAEAGKMSDDEALEKTTQQMSDMLDRRIRNAARDTTRLNSKLDKDSRGCASIPAGRTPCPFCLEMAAVGVAYSFKVLDIEGRRFHDHCRCRFVPGFIGHDFEVMIEGKPYNSDAIRTALDDVRQTLGYSLNTRLTNAQMYQMRKELERRDLDWIMSREVPEFTYETPGVKREVHSEAKRHELLTAEKLAQPGYYGEFLRIRSVRNAFGEKRDIPTPDLAMVEKEWEVKAPAVGKNPDKNYERVENLVLDALRKSGHIVIDNQDGRSDMSDEEVMDHLRGIISFRDSKVKELLFLSKNGKLIKF
jgi:hypothetical protein